MHRPAEWSCFGIEVESARWSILLVLKIVELLCASTSLFALHPLTQMSPSAVAAALFFVLSMATMTLFVEWSSSVVIHQPCTILAFKQPFSAVTFVTIFLPIPIQNSFYAFVLSFMIAILRTNRAPSSSSLRTTSFLR